LSKVAVRSLSSSCSPGGPDLASVGPRLLSLSVEAVTDLLQGMAGLLGPVLSGGAARCMPTLPRLARTDCCAIPEVDCPPRCVCEITWQAARGEKLGCSVRVVNSSASSRTFHLSATGFAGSGGAGTAPISVSPQSLQLPARSSGVFEAAFAVPDELAPGNYEAEIVVRGAYEQCIRVLLRVTRRPSCGPDLPHCRCEITQGDPPVRIRAHHWYDHFQCSEPCAPVRKADDDRDHR
jgi:hypothetical protein